MAVIPGSLVLEYIVTDGSWPSDDLDLSVPNGETWIFSSAFQVQLCRQDEREVKGASIGRDVKGEG